ncbi:Synoviolin-like protein [Operophtera brumata]|uniref:Synoviolin-like protein n=1 Tax=Operophtera brumata TaxID=104452 RepID=A0A0L7LRM5_OPEBR|nr:Synoviolin-like protein [Operophtera brumata]
MKAVVATVISLALTTVVIGNAYYQKKQFYPSIVYLTNSNPSMAHLIERSWYAITETCLAFTVFRDDFNPKFIALFTLLLFLKAFHWLAEDRVDYFEYFQRTKSDQCQPDAFGAETLSSYRLPAGERDKYALHAIDSRWETPWENKAAVLLYTELAINFFKVLLYIGFVAVMVRIYTLPLFAFRPMSFKKAYNDVVLSRRAIRNMNTLYPDATPAELAAADNECIICREEMHTGKYFLERLLLTLHEL